MDIDMDNGVGIDFGSRAWGGGRRTMGNNWDTVIEYFCLFFLNRQKYKKKKMKFLYSKTLLNEKMRHLR